MSNVGDVHKSPSPTAGGISRRSPRTDCIASTVPWRLGFLVSTGFTFPTLHPQNLPIQGIQGLAQDSHNPEPGKDRLYRVQVKLSWSPVQAPVDLHGTNPLYRQLGIVETQFKKPNSDI